MEIRGISQGGQVNFDPVNNLDKGNSKNSTSANGQVENELVNKNAGINSKEKEISEKDIKKAVDKLNKFLEDDKTHAEYEVHDKFKDVMIKIIDDNTGKVIQEFPPKKILDMVAKMCEMVGVLFDKKA